MFPEIILDRTAWLTRLTDQRAAFLHPLVHGTLTNPGWRDGAKRELLLAFKPPALIAERLAAQSGLLASAVPGSMAFDPLGLHSTIAIIKIPERVRYKISLEDLAAFVYGAVSTATNRWLTAHTKPLMTAYPYQVCDQPAIMAWPEKTGVLFDLRTAILTEILAVFESTPGLEDIEIRDSWAEHITLVRFMREFGPIHFQVHENLRLAMQLWKPIPRFAMSAVELSIATIEGGALHLEPIVTVDLPTQETEPQS